MRELEVLGDGHHFQPSHRSFFCRLGDVHISPVAPNVLDCGGLAAFKEEAISAVRKPFLPTEKTLKLCHPG